MGIRAHEIEPNATSMIEKGYESKLWQKMQSNIFDQGLKILGVNVNYNFLHPTWQGKSDHKQKTALLANPNKCWGII